MALFVVILKVVVIKCLSYKYRLYGVWKVSRGRRSVLLHCAVSGF